jgi:CRP/FNR family cyclic AMP-dependent transcriptional regulator
MTTSDHSSEITAMLQHATRKRFSPKSLIMREGENSAAVYFVLAGSVTVWVEDPDGEELILAYLGPGEFFGELSLFDANAKRSASVRARTDCEVAVITYEKFRDLIQAAPSLLMPIIGQIAHRLRVASQKLGNLAFVDVAGRIARALLDLAADSQAITHPDGMLVRITREELGKLVNCSRQMAGQVLFDLERHGLIEVHGKSIIVRATIPAKNPLTP